MIMMSVIHGESGRDTITLEGDAMNTQTKQVMKLRYDGKWTGIEGQPRQWTIKGTFLDKNGVDRNGSSFWLEGILELLEGR